MAQSVVCPIRDVGLGHDLMGHGMEPCVGLHADNVEPAWDSLFPSLLSLACSLPLSLSKQINKNFVLGLN